jgi:hypothetical protein
MKWMTVFTLNQNKKEAEKLEGSAPSYLFVTKGMG